MWPVQHAVVASGSVPSRRVAHHIQLTRSSLAKRAVSYKRLLRYCLRTLVSSDAGVVRLRLSARFSRMSAQQEYRPSSPFPLHWLMLGGAATYMLSKRPEKGR